MWTWGCSVETSSRKLQDEFENRANVDKANYGPHADWSVTGGSIKKVSIICTFREQFGLTCDEQVWYGWWEVCSAPIWRYVGIYIGNNQQSMLTSSGYYFSMNEPCWLCYNEAHRWAFSRLINCLTFGSDEHCLGRLLFSSSERKWFRCLVL